MKLRNDKKTATQKTHIEDLIERKRRKQNGTKERRKKNEQRRNTRLHHTNKLKNENEEGMPPVDTAHY